MNSSDLLDGSGRKWWEATLFFTILVLAIYQRFVRWRGMFSRLYSEGFTVRYLLWLMVVVAIACTFAVLKNR